MVTSQQTEESENILLVEGEDDLHVVLNLYQRIENQEPNFWILDKKGFNNLLADINNQIRKSQRQKIGIVFDADCKRNSDGQMNRWVDIRDKIRELNGIVIRKNIARKGTIIKGRPDGIGHFPRIGIWMMPDNQSPGELEEFIDSMIPTDNPARRLAKSYISCILKEVSEANDKGRLAERKTLRAEIHAWLATRKRPRHLGAAIAAEYLNTNVKTSTEFIGWVKRLFS
ncbi:MAG: hypothetical protein OXE02_05345 [Chloroflexi bacterium]|nr:hypothetical protein [Chloroflexota bacterium]